MAELLSSVYYRITNNLNYKKLSYCSYSPTQNKRLYLEKHVSINLCVYFSYITFKSQ